jgi:arabinofuranosyltransferase
MDPSSTDPRPDKSSEGAPSGGWTAWLRAAPWIASAVLLGSVFYKAWVGDDAAITARVIDNLLHGYGLRWNVDERVQAFTHPLWALLLIPLMACGIGWYPALIALGLSTTAAAVSGVSYLSRLRPMLGVLVLSVLGFSRAFLDYSTSGLENPLAACLIVALLIVVPPAVASARDVRRVAFVVALLALTRLDLVLLGLPACGYVMFRAARAGARARSLAAALTLGVLPLILWEGFSLSYYGFPFPNTAYAKLNTGIAQDRLLRLGIDYFCYTLAHDPWTLIAALGLTVALFAFRVSPAALALGVGALTYYAYVLWIGGDFMGGRFFVAPLVLLAGLIVSHHVALPRRIEAFAVAGALILGTLLWLLPLLRPVAPRRYGPVDERATYAKSTGLLRVLLTRTPGVDHNWLRRGAQWREDAAANGDDQGPAYRHGYAIGMLGLAAGPHVHIIDHLALTDPFLARLPAAYDPKIQPGHFERMGQWSAKQPVTLHCPLEYEVCRFWRDYEQTLRTSVCALDDVNLCQYWQALRTVTQAELSSNERWRAILELNLGRLDHLIDRRRYREASLEYPGER